jgi:hypothetical protein
VRFAIYPQDLDGPRVLAEISENALEELFGADKHPKSWVSACCVHFDFIKEVALQRYRYFPEVPICLRTVDFFVASGSKT